MWPSMQKVFFGELTSAFSGWGFTWKGLINNQKGEWWLIGQILLISAHLFPPWPELNDFDLVWPKPLKLSGACLFFIGLVLAIRALSSLGSNLSPLPDPKLEAKLVTKGSYRNCRHPLYQALLMSSCGTTLLLGSMLHTILSLCLGLLLIGKAKREERKLKIKHLEYANYINNTPAIIPNIPFFDWRA